MPGKDTAPKAGEIYLEHTLVGDYARMAAIDAERFLVDRNEVEEAPAAEPVS